MAQRWYASAQPFSGRENTDFPEKSIQNTAF
jgi:hypothetical protein